MSQFETEQAPSIRNLIESRNYYDLSSKDRKNVRLFVYHLYLRSAQTRHDINSYTNKLNQYFGIEMPLDPKVFQTDIIQDEDKFEQMNFTILENMTSIPFYTSDNPVVNFAIEIHLPLTPTLSLALLDSKIFKTIEYIKLQSNRHVIYQNFLQLCNSSRFVYSSKDFLRTSEMLKSAQNWRKSTSRYDEHGFVKATSFKPMLQSISSYEFEALNSDIQRWLQDIQHGSRSEILSDDRTIPEMFRMSLRKALDGDQDL